MRGTIEMDNVKGFTVTRDPLGGTVRVEFHDGRGTVKVDVPDALVGGLVRELS